MPFLGIVIAMISQINSPIATVTPKKINPIVQSMIRDAMSAPSTMNGERKKSRKKRFTPFSDWLISAVMRVMRVGMPSESSSACEKELIFLYTAVRSSVP